MLLTPRRGRAVSGSSSRPESSVPYRVDLRKGSISAAGLNWAGKQFGLSNIHGGNMSLGTILLIILVLLLIGALPSWPYSAAWGPAPAGILGVVLIVVLILVLMGRF
jgi:uncharacterized protein DUF3309